MPLIILDIIDIEPNKYITFIRNKNSLFSTLIFP